MNNDVGVESVSMPAQLIYHRKKEETFACAHGHARFMYSSTGVFMKRILSAFNSNGSRRDPIQTC